MAALREATEAIAAAKVPANLREIAFAKSLDHLLGARTQPQLREAKESTPKELVSSAKSDSTGSALSKIAAALNMDVDTVERVFEAEGDEIHIIVAPKALASAKQTATRELAYLVSASRQAAGIEDQTAAATIKDVCDHFGVLDTNNFGGAITKLGGEGLRISGSGESRHLKINKVGYEKASEIVARVASGVAK